MLLIWNGIPVNWNYTTNRTTKWVSLCFHTYNCFNSDAWSIYLSSKLSDCLIRIFVRVRIYVGSAWCANCSEERCCHCTVKQNMSHCDLNQEHYYCTLPKTSLLHTFCMYWLSKTLPLPRPRSFLLLLCKSGTILPDNYVYF
jgi:hypothetical protein